MRSVGLPCSRRSTSGRLIVQAYLPEATGVEEHCFGRQGARRAPPPSTYIVDSISAASGWEPACGLPSI